MSTEDAKASERAACGISACAGAIGVLLGFALFVTLTFTVGHEGVSVVPLLIGLGAGATIASVSEWIAHVIESGHVKFGWPGAASFKRLFTFLILITIFELFVSSAGEMPKIMGAHGNDVSGMIGAVFQKRDEPKLADMLRKLDQIIGTPSTQPGIASAGEDAVLRRIADLMRPSDHTALFIGRLNLGLKELSSIPAEVTKVDDDTCRYDAAPRAGGEAKLLYGKKLLEEEDEPQDPPSVPRSERRPLSSGLPVLRFSRACVQSLKSLSFEARVDIFKSALLRVLSRRDFVDDQTFPDLPRDHVARQQRDICASITAATPADAGCLRSDDGRLLPLWASYRINLELLRTRAPDLVTPGVVSYIDLIAFIIAWCLSAAMLGWLLARRVFRVPAVGQSARTVLRQVGFALLAAGAAGGILGLTILVGRAINLVVTETHWAVLFVFPALFIVGWPLGELFARLSDRVSVGIFRSLFMNVFAVFMMLPMFAVGALLLLGIVTAFGGIVSATLLAAGCWLIPALILTFVLPVLRPASTVPRIWGVVALGVAAALMCLTLLLQGSDGTQKMVALALLALGFLMLCFSWTESKISDIWPLIALAISITVLKLMNIVGDAFAPMIAKISLVVSELDFDGFWDIAETSSADPHAHEIANFQLAIVSSVGFWLTIALLVAWSVRLHQESGAPDGSVAKDVASKLI